PEPAQPIVEDDGGIAATLRFVQWAAKSERAADVEERKPRCNRRARGHGNAEIGGIEQTIRSECEMDTIETQANRVIERGGKSVIFAEAQQLAETVAGVAKAGDIRGDGSAGRRFLAEILLNDIVKVEAVVLAELVVDVGRALVERNVGHHAAAEDGEGVGVRRIASADHVRSRDQWQQFLDS